MLAVMVNNIAHGLFLTLLQLVLCLEVLRNELIDWNEIIIIIIYLVEEFVDNFIASVFIMNLLLVLEEIMQLLPCNRAISVYVDWLKLLFKLLPHVVLYACLLYALVDCAEISQTCADILVLRLRCIGRGCAWRQQHINVRHIRKVIF